MRPENPVKQIIALIRKDPNKSIPGLVFRWVRAFISMPGRISKRIKSGRALMKKVRAGEIPSLEVLLNSLPERMFIRSGDQIRELFAGLNFPPQRIMEFDNCKIARL